MSDQPTIQIADVMPDAIAGRVRDLLPGDHVFDVYGGRHVVTRALHLRDGSTRIVRADGTVSYFQSDDTMTFVPSSALREV